MSSMLKNNGLSLTMVGLFLFSLIGQAFSGHSVWNNELQEHGLPPLTFTQYLTSAHLVEAIFENWESEFLQMGSYVILTAYLYQRGSAESRPLPDEQSSTENSLETAPASGSMSNQSNYSWIYQHSLSLALFALFLISFTLHAVGGAALYSTEEVLNHRPPVSVWEYLFTSNFWFESLQNWQSEYLSIAALIVLSIYLREKNSPESKSLLSPNSKTGE